MYTTIFLFICLSVITLFMWIAVNGIATSETKLTTKFLKWSPVIMFVLIAILVIALWLDGELFTGSITNYF